MGFSLGFPMSPGLQDYGLRKCATSRTRAHLQSGGGVAPRRLRRGLQRSVRHLAESEESEVVVMWLAILTHNNNNGSTKPLHTKRIPRRVSPPQPDRLGPALISTQDSGDAAQGYGGSQPREARD